MPTEIIHEGGCMRLRIGVALAAALAMFTGAAYAAVPGMETIPYPIHEIRMSDCDLAAVSGNIIAISMDEWEQSQDLNHDGVIGGRVLGYYDIEKKKLTNTRINIGGSVGIDGDTIVVQIPEDGQWWGGSLGYYSIKNNKLFKTKVKIKKSLDEKVKLKKHTLKNTGVSNGRLGERRSISGGKIVFLGYDHDLNGDGYVDPEICFYDIATDKVIQTGIEGSNPTISGDLIAFAATSDPTVEQYWLKPKVEFYNTATGEITDTGLSGNNPVIDHGVIVFSHLDTTTWANSLWTYDIVKKEAKEVIAAPFASRDYSISNGKIVMLANERDGWGDLDGDGNETDYYMLVIYDIATGRTINTRVQGCCGPEISGDVVIFDTYENDIQTDLNGDGDMDDCIQRYIVLSDKAW